MKKEKRRSIARSLTRRIVIWLFVLMGLTSFCMCFFTMLALEYFYSFSYHNSMRSTTEYTRRVQSDIYVAVTNNLALIESQIDHPEQLQATMEQIVSTNNRIRSCGINFIDSYYPQYGRWFCPYAWKEDMDGDGIKEVQSNNMGAGEYDYLHNDWFLQAIKADTAYWCDPFFDGYDSKTPLVAYLVPVHNKKGRTVAILGADVSLDWLTTKLHQVDSVNNASQFSGDERDAFSHTFIIDRKGTYICHPDEKRILTHNFFDDVKPCEETDSIRFKTLCQDIVQGKISDNESAMRVFVDDQECILFFMPVKHTSWIVITVVPWYALQLPGIVMVIFQLFFIVITLIVMYIICWYLVKRTTKPLRKLAVSADEVAKGNFNACLPKLHKHDEIHQLRDSFENMQTSLTRYIEELKDTTASKAAIENELRIAHDIQMAMLPKKFPPYPERDDLDIFGSLVPAKAVGGDLFDFFIRDNQFFFCIGDVSGKGVPASLVMAVTRSLFRNVTAHVADPGRITVAINDALSEGNERNMFVTFFVGVLNLETHELRYCNAGHNAPFVLTDNVSLLPVESNLPLGVMAGWEFVSQQINMAPDTTIFLYTDGLTEAENIEHLQFGEDNAQDVLRQCIAGEALNSEEMVHQMTMAVHAFVGEAEQSDDLTMLAIKRNK